MSERGSTSTPEFLSTHPSDEKRVKEIEKHLPDAMKYYNAAIGAATTTTTSSSTSKKTKTTNSQTTKTTKSTKSGTGGYTIGGK